MATLAGSKNFIRYLSDYSLLEKAILAEVRSGSCVR